MSENTAIIIYKATILPLFDYNDIIYGLLNAQQQQLKLQRIQNRALRVVFRGKVLSVREMHDRANVETLDLRRKGHLMALMYERTHDPNYIDNTPRVSRRAAAKMLKVPKPKTNRLKKGPKYNGSVKWNDLPPKVRQAKTKLELKNLLKKHKAGRPLEWFEEAKT